jgi:HEPN domain-containing protein
MTKQEYIDYWVSTSEDDWGTVEDLFKTKHYLQTLFFAHLVLEKLCKAIWVKYNESNHPSRVHNLAYLLKQTPIEISDPQMDFLLIFNDFQLEGRYPDYRKKIYKTCDEETTKSYLEQVKEHRIWLLSKLQ